MDSISYGEILFWRVFRGFNYWLNKQIFYQLSTMEIRHVDYKKYHIDNRIKFKYIYSLEWMLEKKEFELIEYKILNNEFISITSTSIRKLIKLINYKNNGDQEDEEEEEEDDYPTKIFKLLMKLRRNEVLRYDLFSEITCYRKYKVLEILMNDPNYELQYSPNLYKDLSRYRPTVRILKLFLRNSKNLIEPTSLDNHLICNNNLKYQVQIAPFILNQTEFPKLYLIPTPGRGSYNYDFDSLNHLFIISSNELRNLFLDKDYFIKSYKLELEFDKCLKYIINGKEFRNKLIKVELILIYIKIYYKCSSDDGIIPSQIQDKINDLIIKFKVSQDLEKELLILLIKVSKNDVLHTAYFFKYYEIIEESSNDIISKLKFKEGFKSYDQVKKSIDKLILSYNGTNNNEGFKNDLLKIIKSITNQISLKQFQINKPIVNLIRNIIFNYMDSIEWYEKAIQSIPIEKIIIFDLPLEWNKQLRELMIEPMKSQLFVIKDKQVIDWLSSKCKRPKNHNLTLNPKSEYYNKRKNNMVTFESKELETYAIFKLEIGKIEVTLEPIKWSQILNNPIPLSLFEECGIKIDSIIDECYQNQSNQNILNLVKYLIPSYSIDTKVSFLFQPKLISHFINQVIYNDKINGNCNGELALSNAKVDMSNYTFNPIQFLIVSIIEYNLISSKFILNNLDLSSLSDQFLKEWSHTVNSNIYKQVTSNLLFANGDICTIKNINIDKVIGYVKFWIDSIPSTNSSVYETIINHLYKKLIQIQGISIENVIFIRNLIIKNSSIKLYDNSLFHMFYYLNIKSTKIIGFLFLVESINVMILGNNSLKEYNSDLDMKQVNKRNEKDTIRELFNLNIFTFEFLFGSYNDGYTGAAVASHVVIIVYYY